MYDILIKLLTTVRGMWRFRWWAMLVMWVVFVVGAVVINLMPDVYESQTRVFIDTQSVLRPLLKGLAIETDVQDKVEVMTRAILSRPNLETLIRETDLNLEVNTPEELESMVLMLQNSVSVTKPNRKQQNLYVMGYANEDPNVARLVVQTLLDLLVERTLGSSRADTAKAQQFLESQINEYEVRLTGAEQRLAAFKKENVGLMPDERGGYYSRMRSEVEAYELKKKNLRLASNKKRELVKQLKGEQANIGTAELDARIQERVSELNDLLLKFTSQHPDVLAVKETIVQLKLQKQEGGRFSEENLKDDSTQGSVYQTIKVSLNETEVEISTLKSEIAEQESRINKLQALVDTIPEVEANLAKLNRDYSVTKDQYEQLLERLESARISEGAEKNTDEIQFRIIDPPNLPLRPTGPNRVMFLFALLLASIGAGLGLAYLLSEIWSVFCSSADLYETTDLPVLGSVSMVWTEGEKKAVNRNAIKLAAIFSGLLFVFVLIVALQFVLR